MADLYNNKTGITEKNIAEGDVNSKIQSGTYDLLDGPNRKYYVGTNDGTVLHVNGMLAADYIRAGSANYIAPRQAQGMIENKDFAESAMGQLAAIPYGAEDYLGAGIFSSVGEALGIAPGQREAVQAANPWTWHTSGIIPSLIAAWFSGGTTAIGQAGAKQGTKKVLEKAARDTAIKEGADSLVSRGVNTTKSFLADYTLPGIGAKVANRVQGKTYDALMKSGSNYVPTSLGNVKLIKQFGPHAAKILSGSIAAGVEGGIWGAGEGISEAILGEPEDAAEHIFNSIGTNMLIGVGFGGAVSAAVPMLTGAAGMGAVGLRKMIGGGSVVGGKTLQGVTPFIRAVAEKNGMQPEQIDRMIEALGEDGMAVMEQMADLKTNLDKHAGHTAELVNALLLSDDFVQLTDVGGFNIDVLIDLIRATKNGEVRSFALERFKADPLTIRAERELRKLKERARKKPTAEIKDKIKAKELELANLEEAFIAESRIPSFSSTKPSMPENQLESLMEARAGIDITIQGLRDIGRQYPELIPSDVINNLIRAFNEREAAWYRNILSEETEDLMLAQMRANDPKPKPLTRSEEERMSAWASHWDDYNEQFLQDIPGIAEAVLHPIAKKMGVPIKAPGAPAVAERVAPTTDALDEFRRRAEADVGSGVITNKVTDVIDNLRKNVGDDAADAYEAAAKAQAQKNLDIKTGAAELPEEARLKIANLRERIERIKGDVAEGYTQEKHEIPIWEEEIGQIEKSARLELEIPDEAPAVPFWDVKEIRSLSREEHARIKTLDDVIANKTEVLDKIEAKAADAKDEYEKFTEFAEKAERDARAAPAPDAPVFKSRGAKDLYLVEEVERQTPGQLIYTALGAATRGRKGHVVVSRKQFFDHRNLDILDAKDKKALFQELIDLGIIQKVGKQFRIDVSLADPNLAQTGVWNRGEVRKILEGANPKRKPKDWDAPRVDEGALRTNEGFRIELRDKFENLHQEYADGMSELEELRVKRAETWKGPLPDAPMPVAEGLEPPPFGREELRPTPATDPFIYTPFTESIREIKGAGGVDLFNDDFINLVIPILSAGGSKELRLKSFSRRVSDWLTGRPDLVSSSAHAKTIGKDALDAAQRYMQDLSERVKGFETAGPSKPMDYSAWRTEEGGSLVERLNQASRDEGRAIDFGGVLEDLKVASQIASDTGDASQLAAIYKKFGVALETPKGITQDRYNQLKQRLAPWTGAAKEEEARRTFRELRDRVTPVDEGGKMTHVSLISEFGELGQRASSLQHIVAEDAAARGVPSASVYDPPDIKSGTLRQQILALLSTHVPGAELPERVIADSFKVLEDMQTSLLKNMQYGSLPSEGPVADRITNHIIEELRRMQTDTSKWGLMGAMKSQFTKMSKEFALYRGQVLQELTSGVGPTQKPDAGKIISMFNELDSETSAITMDRLSGYSQRATDLLAFIRANFEPVDFADILRTNPTALNAIEDRLGAINIQRAAVRARKAMPGELQFERAERAAEQIDIPGTGVPPRIAGEVTEEWSDHLTELMQFVEESSLDLNSSLKYIEDELPLAKLLSSNNAREANLGNVLSDLGRGGVAASLAWAGTGSPAAAAAVGLGVGSMSLALDPKRLMVFIHQLRIAREASQKVIDDYLEGWLTNTLPKSAIHKSWEKNARQALLIGTQASRRDIKESKTEVRKRIAKDRSTDAWSNRIQASLDAKLTGESYFEASKSFGELVGSVSLMTRFLEDSTKMFEHTPDLRNAMMDSLRNRVNYAYSIMPRPSGGFLQKPIAPTQMELDKWGAALRVLNSPTDTLLTALLTNSLTKDMVDTLRNGWPKIYEQLSAKVLEGIAAPGRIEGLTKEQKMSISILLGMPFMNQTELTTLFKTWQRDETGKGASAAGRGGAGVRQMPDQYAAGTTVGTVERLPV